MSGSPPGFVLPSSGMTGERRPLSSCRPSGGPRTEGRSVERDVSTDAREREKDRVFSVSTTLVVLLQRPVGLYVLN